MSAPAATPAPSKGVVKQVVSGDTVIIRGQPKAGPPPEKTIVFANVTAPKIPRRPANGAEEEAKDEPWAWEAREFLRKKLIGETVYFTYEKATNSNREYGTLYFGSDPKTAVNITELIVSEGLVTVRRGGARSSPELQRLIELEDAAKAAGKGKWGPNPNEHVRSIKWVQENHRDFVEAHQRKPIPAIIEHVRDGSTIRAFLLPDFHYITLMISGIRCPGFKHDSDGKPDPTATVPYAEEARYFVESRLLQRDVEIVLESVINSNFIGSILFPKGNIAEALLREGFAKCADWSMALMHSGTDKLRAAERQAKEKRLRLWADYNPPALQVTGKEKEFNGIVTEIFYGDAINVKVAGGQVKKVFFSSIRPPRMENDRAAAEDGKPPQRPKNFRPLYDIPWMFEAREFLRKKLIGKRVTCRFDYSPEIRDNLPKKNFYTVTIGSTNIAEALVTQGLATVVRYKADDDQRSSRYDDLLLAETAAKKASKGVWKKDTPVHRINDLTVDSSRIKHQYLPSWTRALRTEAIVEYVASGSRFRLFIPKDSCVVAFNLAGITCPRSSRPAIGNSAAQEGEKYGDDALAFSKDKIMHRDVSVHIESTDKQGATVIGWLWIDNTNLSVALVEEGLANVHFSAEKSEHYRALKAAEDNAKAKKKNIWLNYVEETEKEPEPEFDEKEEKSVERKINAENVIVTEVTSELHFYAQHAEDSGKLDALMSKLRQEFQSNPPVSGAYTPKKGDLCAAMFTFDNEWYRAKIEKIQGSNVSVLYIDYGNKETIPSSRLAHLPPAFVADKPFANEYIFALTKLPSDEDDKNDALHAYASDILNKNLSLNVEYKLQNQVYATLMDPVTKNDIGKALISEGLLMAEKRKEARLSELVKEYKTVEEEAKKGRKGMWRYGDITDDDAKEFGVGR